MEANDRKRANPLIATAVGVALAVGSAGLSGTAWAQQATQPRTQSTTQPQSTQPHSTQSPSGSPTSAERAAQQELREAHREIRSAGEEITEARQQSNEAVRAGREAGAAAQEAAREQQNTGYADSSRQSYGQSSGMTSSDGERTRTAEAAGGTSAQSDPQRGGSSSTDAVWLLVPATVSTQTERQSNDCWVRLYSGENFEGRHITIAGPTQVAELRSPYGTGLNNWESAIVGGNATVTTYDGDNFEKRSATLRGGQRYADLGDQTLGLFQDIESIRVTCGSSGSGR